MADIEKFVYYSNGSKKVLKPTDRIVIAGGGLAFEGSTSNDFETELAVVEPTADRTITFPNATGNVLIDSQDLLLNDDIKIKLGTGNDLEIFHDGTNSIIKDTAASGGSTIKYLAGTQTFQNNDSSKTMAVFNAPSSVDLYYNGVKKFETTSAGVQTTGTINLNGAYTFPTTDGTDGQTLKTNGNGTLSFTDNTGLSNIVEDTTPQLGGTLDLNSQSIQGNLIPSAVNTYDLGSSSAEWKDIFLGDNSRILFGNDSDTKITHIADYGLQVSLTMQSSGRPIFALTNSSSDNLGPTLVLHKSALNDEDNDVIGSLEYLVGQNSISTTHVYAETNAVIKSNSDSVEEGQYNIKVSAAGLLTTGLSIEPVSNASTPSVKISGNYYLPNQTPSEGEIIKGSSTSGETTFGKLKDTIMAELSIPGIDLQTDTNAFRFNCPVDLDIVGLDLYLDQHTTSGNVTVTVTNTTDSSLIQSLSVSGTSLSASATPYTALTAGEIITFAITSTPINAQGLRAVLHIERKV